MRYSDSFTTTWRIPSYLRTLRYLLLVCSARSQQRMCARARLVVRTAVVTARHAREFTTMNTATREPPGQECLGADADALGLTASARR